MDRISGLSDELLIKILSLLPTKQVVSTSALSKRWEFLWMWVPKLQFSLDHGESDLHVRDFITRNLPLLKAQVIESFYLRCSQSSSQPEEIKHWVETTVSRCVRELIISYFEDFNYKPVVCLPSSLYTCQSLVTLKLYNYAIVVDVPRTVFLPSLKTLELYSVLYFSKESLPLLLSRCPVLENLVIERRGEDNLKTMVIIVPSLLRLSLPMYGGYPCDEYVIVTPSLKYFQVTDPYRENSSYLSLHMPKVEEADLTVEEDVETLFESITSVKSLTLSVKVYDNEEFMYRDGIVFNQLEHLELYILHDSWLRILVRLLQGSPKLRVLNIHIEWGAWFDEEYEHISWTNDDQSPVPKCLLDSLEVFKLSGYTRRPEEKDSVSYILKHACHLKSSSIVSRSVPEW